MKPEVIRTIAELRERVAGWRREDQSIGMTPTMGALHEGHLALVREAQKQTERTIVTLFVNPAQFAPTEDLRSYPRDEDSDRGKLAALGADVLFAPPGDEIYPAGFDTRIMIGGPAAAGLEAEIRPHFFIGVATVVAKLLLIGLPDKAFFGEKDYQQLLVVKQLVRDLNMPTEIVGCPTVREADGLAMSSRNAYLSPEERGRAPILYATLRDVAAKLRSGECGDPLSEARRRLEHAGFSLDYLELRSAATLSRVADIAHAPLRLLVAASLGRTRLIDNVAV